MAQSKQLPQFSGSTASLLDTREFRKAQGIPLPVHISAKSRGRRERDRLTWDLVLVRQAGLYYAIILEVAEFDLLGVLQVSGATGTRTYPRGRSNPFQDTGWVWRGHLQVPCSELFYNKETSALDRSTLPYSRYLKEAARDVISNEYTLARVVHQFNQGLNTCALKESQRRAFLALREEDTSSALATIWDFSASPPVALEYQSLQDDEADQDAPNCPTDQPSQSVEEPCIRGDLFEAQVDADAGPLTLGPLTVQLVAPASARRNPPRGANKELLEQLGEGVIKNMMRNPDPAVLDPLYIRFPNFKVALDKVSKQLHLLKRSSTPVPLHLRPLLLVGGSGVGKSHFAWQLSKMLGFEAREIDFATATAGFVLSGAAPQWAEAKHGMVFDELVNGPYGNPMFIGNEVDKSIQDGVRFPPLGPLYTLLESETAHRFIDEFAETAIDASYVSWVLTANDTRTIPVPLLMRMDVVEIPAPTAEQLLLIGQNIYHDLLSKAPWGHTFPAALQADVLSQVVQSGAPRQMRTLLMDALGQAAVMSAEQVLSEHVTMPPNTRHRIGFTP